MCPSCHPNNDNNVLPHVLCVSPLFYNVPASACKTFCNSTGRFFRPGYHLKFGATGECSVGGIRVNVVCTRNIFF